MKSAASALVSLLGLLIVSVLSVTAVLSPELPSEEQLEFVDDEPEPTSVEEVGPSALVIAPSQACQERDVRVSQTGKFAGAKLRAVPGFEHEQAGIVTRGAHLVVCETAETPGTKVPNRWYRIADGKYKGLWIHKQVLDF